MLRSTTARVLTATGAVAAAGLLTATAAFAHGAPFTVTAGSAQAGTSVAFTANSIANPAEPTGPHVVLRDTTTNQALPCNSARLNGTIRTGGSTGAAVATVDGSKAVFTNCLGISGLKYALTGVGVWNLDIGESSAGSSTGSITNFRAHVVTTAGPTCAFDIGASSGSFSSSGTATVNPGTLPSRYTNSTQQLALLPSSPGSVGLWNVHGSGTNTYCISPSILKQGDLFSISVTFKVTADVAANNPIAVN